MRIFNFKREPQKSEEEYRHDYTKCLDVIKSIKTEEHWVTASKYIGLFSKKWCHFYKNEIPTGLDVLERTEQLINLLNLLNCLRAYEELYCEKKRMFIEPQQPEDQVKECDGFEPCS